MFLSLFDVFYCAGDSSRSRTHVDAFCSDESAAKIGLSSARVNDLSSRGLQLFLIKCSFLTVDHFTFCLCNFLPIKKLWVNKENCLYQLNHFPLYLIDQEVVVSVEGELEEAKLALSALKSRQTGT